MVSTGSTTWRTVPAGRRRVAGVCLGLLLLVLTGCGQPGVLTTAPTVGPTYDGPMDVAAARTLECDHEPSHRGRGDYGDGGLETVQGTPAEALENYLSEEGWLSQLPGEGYRVEREDGDRVLMSYDVDGRTRIAFMAADGIRDFNGDVGWGIDTWAQCDPAELPATVTDALGIGVWTDGTGARVPTAKVRSFHGAEHCDWQDITFVTLGPERDGDQYVRDVHGELAEVLRSTYAAPVELPDGATDTGLQRDGRRLWLAPGHDAAYLVSVDDPADVERWPAAKEPIYCM